MQVNLNNHVLESKNEYCTADYGPRQPDYPTHKGMDFINASGGACSIIAVADGEVIGTCNVIEGHSDVYTAGNYAIIKHSNGVKTRYLHMKRGTVCVKVGDKVKAGDKLGFMGDTGYSFGVHLHFDVNDGTSYVDPLPYLMGEKSFYANEPTPAPTPKPAPSGTTFKVGDKVTIKEGAYWTTGDKVPSFCYGVVYTVDSVATDNVLLDSDGVNSRIAPKYLELADSESTATFKVGDMVSIKPGSYYYESKIKVPNWVCANKYRIDAISGDRVLLDSSGLNSAVASKDLIKA